ncbi:hypothetical protein M8A51_11380 [Schlegelella sp. S2-27]|uniref:Uncharacterized protein n=1 Tax=Caldimonas mangrovi TaxID=2944811 RepID=A0ABT0YN31_9BURK|nr:hypothetical protein [Caldimonas mangrovi]MCM5680135.1 hypothetical protein [Caldimonas mangrovi]
MNPTLAPSPAAWLNGACHCIRLDRARLRDKLAEGPLGDAVLSALASRPGLFSDTAVFIDHADASAMVDAVSDIDRVMRSVPFQQGVLDAAPELARHARASLGGILGFDFHLSAEGPRLIEINTNAGGMLLNLELGRAQAGCCSEADRQLPPLAPEQGLAWRVIETFRHEWRLDRGDAPLRTVAIVDDDPQQQYLYPELLLFQQRFQWMGWSAAIVDPSGLTFRDGVLWHQDTRIDLVYNRLTDFYLDEPRHAALRAAYEAHAVVLTPHPGAHALCADKRNLAMLRDGNLLAACGLGDDAARRLQSMIPATERVVPQLADALWQRRRQLFFKPACGYAGKAAYRGDKLTRGRFAEMLAHPYVAQALVPPSARTVWLDGAPASLKADVRCYAYEGRVMLMAARLYQGQTTNFRTPGGGFAPVLRVPPALHPAVQPQAAGACCSG